MNSVTKLLVETGVVYSKSKEKRDAALDIMYDKLVVIPIQKAWRSKTKEQKAAISSFIKMALDEPSPCSCCYSSRWAGTRWDKSLPTCYSFE